MIKILFLSIFFYDIISASAAAPTQADNAKADVKRSAEKKENGESLFSAKLRPGYTTIRVKASDKDKVEEWDVGKLGARQEHIINQVTYLDRSTCPPNDVFDEFKVYHEFNEWLKPGKYEEAEVYYRRIRQKAFNTVTVRDNQIIYRSLDSCGTPYKVTELNNYGTIWYKVTYYHARNCQETTYYTKDAAHFEVNEFILAKAKVLPYLQTRSSNAREFFCDVFVWKYLDRVTWTTLTPKAKTKID